MTTLSAVNDTMTARLTEIHLHNVLHIRIIAVHHWSKFMRKSCILSSYLTCKITMQQ